MEITAFIPCFVDVAAVRAGQAMVQLLEGLGHRVRYPKTQTCCGQMAYNVGRRRDAAALARRFCDLFADSEVVVAPSGSCVAMVRSHYADLLDGGDDRGVPARTFELSEFLVDVLGIVDVGAPSIAAWFPKNRKGTGGSRTAVRAGLHVGCHLRRELDGAGAPERLLAAVPDLEVIPMDSGEWCCGFGGTFSVKHPEVSAAMGEWKVREAASLDLDLLVSTEPSCCFQLDGLLRRQARDTRACYIAEVLLGTDFGTDLMLGVDDGVSSGVGSGVGSLPDSSRIASPHGSNRAAPKKIGVRGRMAALVAQDDLRQKLTRATTRSLAKRKAVLQKNTDWERLRKGAAAQRRGAVAELDELVNRFRSSFEHRGGKVSMAKDAASARRMVVSAVRAARACLVVKSKSMATEEINLNAALEDAGIRAVETDLGEFVVQLAGDRPSHVTAPCLHMSGEEIAALFERNFSDCSIDGTGIEEVAVQIMAAARKILRKSFLEAGLGISGANFLVAETGHIVVVENEGNARLVTSLPRHHLVVAGIDKIVPTIRDLGPLLSLLAPSATGQTQSCYVSLIPPSTERTVVLLDNGRGKVASDPDHRDILACIRCGACMNVCPVFRQVGGHGYGGVYPGPLGAVLLPHLKGIDAFGDLPFACSLCGACSDVCPVGIPLSTLIHRWRERLAGEPRNQDAVPEDGGEAKIRLDGWAASLISRLAMHPRLWHAMAGTWSRLPPRLLTSLPGVRAWHAHRELPPQPETTFRKWWSDSHESWSSRSTPTPAVVSTPLKAAGESLARIVKPEKRISIENGLSNRTRTLTRTRSYPCLDLLDRQGLLAEFEAAFLQLGGPGQVELVSVKEDEEIPGAVERLLDGVRFHDIMVEPGFPDGWLPPGLRTYTPGAETKEKDAPSSKIGVILQPPSKTEREPYAGLTEAVALIASTGSIVLRVRDRKSVRSSLLCHVHVAVAQSDIPVFPNPEIFWDWLATSLADDSGLVIVSGPSRTADVEKVVVIPAHGPASVAVVLVVPNSWNP